MLLLAFCFQSPQRGGGLLASAAAATMQHVNKDIPPELQGVSVKELVKVIGESRANGNGVTPPDTPRRQLSRSASPSVATLQTAGTVAGSRGSSPGSSLEASGAGSSPVQGHGHQRGRRSQIRSSQSPDPGLVPNLILFC